MSYNFHTASIPGIFSINLSNQQAQSPAFAEGEEDVDLPNGDPPYVNWMGTGVQYFQQFTPRWGFAAGANYQVVSVRDGIFSSQLEPVDAEDNPLTIDSDGTDTLLTLNVGAMYDSTDNRNFPNQGFRVQLGINQAIPVGEAQIAFTRLAGNFTQFVALHPFGAREPHVLVLNAQAGTIMGTVPPYEAFNLVGPNTVRGFNTGGLASSSSFIEATVEYRFPLFAFGMLKQKFNVGGAVFFDYGNDLGTASEVEGDPGEAREKAGEGIGYGLGIQARSTIGFIRLEMGFDDQGGSAFYFLIGDRF